MTAYVEEDEGLRDNPSLLVVVQTCTGTLQISTAVSLKMEIIYLKTKRFHYWA